MMFKRLSTRLAKLSNKKVRLFLISAALLAVPLESSQGQLTVVTGSPPCSRGLLNAPVRCDVWARCESSTLRVILRADITMYKTCPGFSVFNDAYADIAVNRTGVVYGANAHLNSQPGPLLDFKYVQYSCAGGRTVSEGSGIPCPEHQVGQEDILRRIPSK